MNGSDASTDVNIDDALLSESTTDTTSDYNLLLPIGVIVVIVLAAACLLLGIVYGYVYFTRVSATNVKKPSQKWSSATRQLQRSDYHHQQSAGTTSDPDHDGNHTTHVFLFRKSNSLYI